MSTDILTAENGSTPTTPPGMTDREIMILDAPFHPNRVSLKPQAFTKNQEKAMFIAYVDAREVMERLDKAFGRDRWTASYTVVSDTVVLDGVPIATLHASYETVPPMTEAAVSWLVDKLGDKRPVRQFEVSCTIRVLTRAGEDSWDGGGSLRVATDVGSGSDAKGAYSDSLKRAAVHLGIGRYLYDLRNVWAEVDSYRQPKDPRKIKIDMGVVEAWDKFIKQIKDGNE